MPQLTRTSAGDAKKLTKSKRSQHRAQNHVRVHLPAIESYEKELEFPADGPGRVVVRLERLMGSDRIRLTDTKYMSTLLERLEEQERKAWAKRRFKRIKVERNRYRQLAIDGLMGPDADMQDLYYHPVFRVNRVLARLSKMDSNITLTPLDNLPRIVPVDPFEFDESGSSFKTYHGHHPISESELALKDEPADDEDEEEEEEEDDRSLTKEVDEDHEEHSNTGFSRSMGKLPLFPHHAEEFPQEMARKSKGRNIESLQEKVEKRISRMNLRASDVHLPSLTDVQMQYGIPPERDLASDWEPFRSGVVDNLFHEEGERVWDLYNLAEDIVSLYKVDQPEKANDWN